MLILNNKKCKFARNKRNNEKFLYSIKLTVIFINLKTYLSEY